MAAAAAAAAAIIADFAYNTQCFWMPTFWVQTANALAASVQRVHHSQMNFEFV